MKVTLCTTLYIRAHNSNAYRSGQWAKVVAVKQFTPNTLPGNIDEKPRPVYIVEFIDGEQDAWPIYDEAHEYEFSSKAYSR